MCVDNTVDVCLVAAYVSNRAVSLVRTENEDARIGSTKGIVGSIVVRTEWRAESWNGQSVVTNAGWQRGKQRYPGCTSETSGASSSRF